jgi:uncharacterized protein YigA (DUF484 family)
MPGFGVDGQGQAGMAQSAGLLGLAEDLRDRIITQPELILEDPDVMRALIAANERAMGGNVVDLRGVAMKRMESRLDRLEDTHRSVIAAAYENLSATNQVHRAVLSLLEAETFERFVAALGGPVAEVLRVLTGRLVLESVQSPDDPVVSRMGGVLRVVPAGFVADYMAGGRRGPVRAVVLRQGVPTTDAVHGDMAPDIRSEALMRLDLGSGRLPGMLALGSEDPHQFRPAQGTDLLSFLAACFERQMRRWLS